MSAYMRIGRHKYLRSAEYASRPPWKNVAEGKTSLSSPIASPQCRK